MKKAVMKILEVGSNPDGEGLVGVKTEGRCNSLMGMLQMLAFPLFAGELLGYNILGYRTTRS